MKDDHEPESNQQIPCIQGVTHEGIRTTVSDSKLADMRIAAPRPGPQPLTQQTQPDTEPIHSCLKPETVKQTLWTQKNEGDER
jgi:hypothetical protein